MPALRSCILALAVGALPALAVAAPARPDFTGMWIITTGETPVVHLSDMSLTPEGRARMQARADEIARGFTQSEGHVKCWPSGMPQMMTASFAIQFIQAKDRLLIAPEVSNLPRTVFFRAAHPAPEDLDPSWNGNSIGHWEGDTLVVDTIGFNDRDAFDFNFDPPVKRTPSLHVTEQMRLEDGGKILADVMTLDDPATFARPFTVTYRYRKLPADVGLMEYVCEANPDAIKAFDEQKTTHATAPKAVFR